jgi:hypothetical protein
VFLCDINSIKLLFMVILFSLFLLILIGSILKNIIGLAFVN